MTGRILAVATIVIVAGGMLVDAQDRTPPDAARLQAMLARFAPVQIGADTSALPTSERQALDRLVAAGRVMDALFLRQVWGGNEALLFDLMADTTPLGRLRLDAFLLDKGPWSRLDHHLPVMPGVPAKPEGAHFYPADATKAEIEAWMKGLPDSARVAAQGFYTTIRRDPTGSLMAVPYSVEYQPELARAAQLLREAAALTQNLSLKRFLLTRADAFLSNDYYASDVAWMELDSAIEPTIGPYEVYEDEWFNAKAAFEAFITIRDDAETRTLEKFSHELQDIEDHLPIDAAHRNAKLGALAPIRVVNVVLAAGDGNRGVQTAAFNLPNDERILRDKGAKRVMLKNVQQAKFEQALLPISRVALSEADQRLVSFDAFFTHILMHELMHGLGPHGITVAGRPSTVRQELKETYSAIEEAKADISGLWALQYLIDKGVVDRSMEETMYVTFLASAFRSIRFGINEAHGRGVAIQLNTLLDAGAVVVAPDGTFLVDRGTIKDAVRGLTTRIMQIQAAGEYGQAQALITKLGVVRPEVKRVLDRLTRVPVDILPRFTASGPMGTVGR